MKKCWTISGKVKRQSENKETKTDSSTGLSDSDKQMLARWEKSRKKEPSLRLSVSLK